MQRRGRGRCSFAFGAVNEAIFGVLPAEPVGIEADQLQLALELHDVRALAGGDIDEQVTIDGRGAAAELLELGMHGSLPGGEELGRLARREVALQDPLAAEVGAEART